VFLQVLTISHVVPIGDVHLHVFLSLAKTVDPIEEPVDSATKAAPAIELESVDPEPVNMPVAPVQKEVDPPA
jgi:hypothetical protein